MSLMSRLVVLVVFGCANCLAQTANIGPARDVANVKLERMPESLEARFALSALPPHLRDAASVYLFDPDQGYVLQRKGTNGFSCFVMRTEWMWPQLAFRDDIFVAMSYDEEGTKKMMPVWTDVAKMRIRGLSPKQAHDEVIKRFDNGTYQKPARTGISYMIAPLQRTYPAPNSAEIATLSLPHYMFYAPNLKDADIGGKPFSSYPFVVQQSPGQHDVIILLVGEAEKANIASQSKVLLDELCAYRNYLCLDTPAHGHGQR